MHLYIVLPAGEVQRLPNPFCTPGALQGTQCENPNINVFYMSEKDLTAGEND